MVAHVDLARPDRGIRNPGPTTRAGGEGRAPGGQRRGRQAAGGQDSSGESGGAGHANLRFSGSADLGRPGSTSQHPGQGLLDLLGQAGRGHPVAGF